MGAGRKVKKKFVVASGDQNSEVLEPEDLQYLDDIVIYTDPDLTASEGPVRVQTSAGEGEPWVVLVRPEDETALDMNANEARRLPSGAYWRLRVNLADVAAAERTFWLVGNER